MKLFFVGAHCTGKTTLARYVSGKHGLPMITEVARSVLAEMETPIERLRTDIDLVDEYQRDVFERQIEAESVLEDEDYVSDRAFDNLAYAAEHSRIAHKIASSTQFKEYVESFKSPDRLLFFVRPHRSLLVSGVDGVRESPEWDAIVRIDGMVKLLLEQSGVPYVLISTPSMQERVTIIDAAIASRKPAKSKRR